MTTEEKAKELADTIMDDCSKHPVLLNTDRRNIILRHLVPLFAEIERLKAEAGRPNPYCPYCGQQYGHMSGCSLLML